MAMDLSALPKIYGLDRTNTVYLDHDAVYRLVRAEARIGYDRLAQENALSRASDWGLVPTELVRVDPSGDLVLKHELIPFVTHPGEWSPGMVYRAAMSMVELAQRLADYGLMLKDGHLLNTTFRFGRPVFFDFGSIVPIENPGRWLEEFRARALVPLWIASLGYGDLMRDFLRTEPRGLGMRLASRRLGKFIPWRMLIAKRFLRTRGWRAALDETACIIDRLRPRLPRSRWSTYNTRVLDEKQPKRDVLLNWAREAQPRSIHELAGNDATIGEMLAKELQVPVISTDADIASVEAAHERTHASGLQLDVGCADLLYPISAYGAGSCRPGAVQRLRADATLATALIHHLVGKSIISMTAFVHIIAHYTERFSIIEWVDPSDKHVVTWREQHGISVPSDYTLDDFLAACRCHFHDVRPLPKSIVQTRTLYACSK